MVTIQKATENAVAFARESLGPERTRSIRLEEIESGKDEGHDVWRITLSMTDNNPADAIALLSSRREYKTFSVLKDTGDVIAMRIREISGA